MCCVIYTGRREGMGILRSRNSQGGGAKILGTRLGAYSLMCVLISKLKGLVTMFTFVVQTIILHIFKLIHGEVCYKQLVEKNTESQNVVKNFVPQSLYSPFAHDVTYILYLYVCINFQIMLILIEC